MERGAAVKRLLFVILLLALVWPAFWALQAWNLRSGVTTWFEDRRADGWDASFDDLRVRGFPSRLDLTLTAPRLYDPDRETGWEAPFFQVLGLSYKPGHVILVWSDSQLVTLPEGRFDVTSDGLRASLIHDADGRVLRSNLEAETLNIDGPDRALAVAGLRLGAQLAEPQQNLYQLGLRADALARPENALGTSGSETLDIQARVVFDVPWRVGGRAGPTPQPREIDLRQAAYSAEGLSLDMAGRVTVDETGRADGELTLRAENWRDLLRAARQSGDLPPALADTLEQGLSLAAGLTGRRDTLDLPLRLRRGEMSLGIIPLGNAPRIRLP